MFLLSVILRTKLVIGPIEAVPVNTGYVVDPFLGCSGFASSIHGICCAGPILASGNGSLSRPSN